MARRAGTTAMTISGRSRWHPGWTHATSPTIEGHAAPFRPAIPLVPTCRLRLPMRTVHSMFALSLALAMWLGAVRCTAAMSGAPPQHVPATVTALSAGLPWAQTLDASPTFTPDGNTAVFSRGTGLARRLCITHRRDGRWSTPKRAPFSGPWMDLEPAMAPDGSYLVFVSNRPATAGGKALDGYFGGKPRPGRGGNLWRVERLADGWGTPVRLPELVNASSATYAPAVAADGSL